MRLISIEPMPWKNRSTGRVRRCASQNLFLCDCSTILALRCHSRARPAPTRVDRPPQLPCPCPATCQPTAALIVAGDPASPSPRFRAAKTTASGCWSRGRAWIDVGALPERARVRRTLPDGVWLIGGTDGVTCFVVIGFAGRVNWLPWSAQPRRNAPRTRGVQWRGGLRSPSTPPVQGGSDGRRRLGRSGAGSYRAARPGRVSPRCRARRACSRWSWAARRGLSSSAALAPRARRWNGEPDLLSDAYRYDRNVAGRLTSPPGPCAAPAAAGGAHDLVASATGDYSEQTPPLATATPLSRRLMAYHTITDSWVQLGSRPPPMSPQAVVERRHGDPRRGRPARTPGARVISGVPLGVERSSRPSTTGPSRFICALWPWAYIFPPENNTKAFFLGETASGGRWASASLAPRSAPSPTWRSANAYSRRLVGMLSNLGIVLVALRGLLLHAPPQGTHFHRLRIPGAPIQCRRARYGAWPSFSSSSGAWPSSCTCPPSLSAATGLAMSHCILPWACWRSTPPARIEASSGPMS